MRVLVIIPALNESASIARVVQEIRAHVAGADVLVIDDGSSDGTAHIAREAGAIAVSLPYNIGVGAALRTGFRFAYRHGYDAVIQCDADGQHPAAEIPKLIDMLAGGTDLVIGSRFAVGGGEYQVEAVRSVAMRVLRVVLRLLTKQRFTDPTSGFRGFSGDMVAEFADVYPREFLSDTVEALLIARYGGFAITEIPVSMQHRQEGVSSHTSFRLMYQYLHLLLVILLTVSLRGRVAQRKQGTS